MQWYVWSLQKQNRKEQQKAAGCFTAGDENRSAAFSFGGKFADNPVMVVKKVIISNKKMKKVIKNWNEITFL